ncbi:probable G-protein coupled receptor 160 [Puntigrus tetrazona]|uniref:probable G-protein coupled receptor 160 n=1 Tax=Puntigrus tetrazona TaxID=1606681 RepID=UPI001C89BFD4|nr:probable G-protein coupled receptor 160 [Puntigrus tetrazona]
MCRAGLHLSRVCLLTADVNCFNEELLASYKKDLSVDCSDFSLGLCRTMETSIPSLLPVLCFKSLLNWLVVVVQRRYIIRSFSGFFCISLAVVDTLLSMVLAAIFCLEDFTISGLHFTRYHVCLLTQITCFIYAVLHWPLFFLVGVDNFWTLSSSSAHTSWKQKVTYVAGACLLWILAALYVFWEPGFVLLLGDDEKQRCMLFSSPQSPQVLLALLLAVTCVILYSYAPFEKWRVQVFLHSTQQSCLVCLRRAMHTFLSTWASFLLVMIISPLLLHVEMHAHLQLNVVWLCFVNSFFVALALCGRSITSTPKKSDTITDGFCSWYLCFTYGTDDWNYGQQCSDRTQTNVKTLNI